MLRPAVVNRFIHETEGSSLGLGGSQLRFRLTDDDAKALGGKFKGGSEFQLVLSPGETYASEELDDYLPGYRPRIGYRADQISPIFLVEKDVGTYRYWGLGNFYTLYHTETSYMAPVPKIDPETSLGQYAVIQHALGGIIAPATQRQSSFDVRAAVGRKIADALALRREYKVLTYARQTSTWNSDQRVTLTSDLYWNGGANSNPLADLQTRILASEGPVTGIFLGQRAAYALLNHPLVRDFIKMSNGDVGLAAQTANALKGPVYGGSPVDFTIPTLPPFHVAGGQVKNPTTGVKEDIIGGDVILISDVDGGEFEGLRTFQTFRSEMMSGTGWVNREFRIEDQGLEGVDAIVAGYAEADVVIANNVGGLIKNAVA